MEQSVAQAMRKSLQLPGQRSIHQDKGNRRKSTDGKLGLSFRSLFLLLSFLTNWKNLEEWVK